MTLGLASACSGIGGTEVAALLAGGYESAWVSEINPHALEVLRRRVPANDYHGDLRLLDPAALDHADLFAAGFPCQPFSVAGKRLGEDDPRNLWPQIVRLLGGLRPPAVLLENVPALRNPFRPGAPEDDDDPADDPNAKVPAYLGQVFGDLVRLGYSVAWDGRAAEWAGAHHRRDRLWIVAWDPARGNFDPFGAGGVPQHLIGRYDGQAWGAGLFAMPVMKWPRAGIIRGVEAYEVTPSSPLGTLAPMWTTPTSGGANHWTQYAQGGYPLPYQVDQALGWPPPNAFDAEPTWGNRAEANGSRHAMSLRHSVPDAMWATAQAHDAAPGEASRDGRFGTEHGGRNLNDQAANAVGGEWQSPTVGDATGGRASKGAARPDDGGLAKQLKGALWPTTTTEDAEQSGPREGVADTLTSATRAAWSTPLSGSLPGALRGNSAQGGIDLLTEAREAVAWPTPRASESEQRTYTVGPSHGNGHGKILQGEVNAALDSAQWATPASQMEKGIGPLGSASQERRERLSFLDGQAVAAMERSGLLNPRWVEGLMGYPPGWTDIEQAELDVDVIDSWRAWGPDADRVGDLDGTNPKYRDYWLWHPALGDLAYPLAPRAPQTKHRLIELGNAWCPQTAADIMLRIRQFLAPRGA